MNTRSHFIGEQIEVYHDRAPTYLKRPGPPSAFIWQSIDHRVVEVIEAWHDYGRRGRMAGNMRDSHLKTAQLRGSWGVGRDYYRVRTDTGEVFVLYYDRAPKGSDHPEGGWFLMSQHFSEETPP